MAAAQTYLVPVIVSVPSVCVRHPFGVMYQFFVRVVHDNLSYIVRISTPLVIFPDYAIRGTRNNLSQGSARLTLWTLTLDFLRNGLNLILVLLLILFPESCLCAGLIDRPPEG